jgi:hypothetical protein
VGLRIDIGIDTNGPHRLAANLPGDAIDVFNLGFAFQIKRRDVGFEGFPDLGIGFADAGVDDLRRIAAGLQRAEQFAAAGDVEAATGLGKQLAQIDVAAAFDRVADGRVNRLERVRDLPVVVQHRGRGIDVGRGSDVARDALDGNVLAIKLAVFVVEEIHGLSETKMDAEVASCSVNIIERLGKESNGAKRVRADHRENKYMSHAEPQRTQR